MDEVQKSVLSELRVDVVEHHWVLDWTGLQLQRSLDQGDDGSCS